MDPIIAFTTPGHVTLGLTLAVAVLFTAASVGITLSRLEARLFVCVTILAHVLPDFDTVTYLFGLTHRDLLGHRGIMHSYAVGGLAAGILAWVFGGLSSFRLQIRKRLLLVGWCVLGAWIHTTADMACDCDEHVLWGWPLSNSRYLLPFRPIPHFTFDVCDGTVWAAFCVELRLILMCIVAPICMLITASQFGRAVVWRLGFRTIAAIPSPESRFLEKEAVCRLR